MSRFRRAAIRFSGRVDQHGGQLTASLLGRRLSGDVPAVSATAPDLLLVLAVRVGCACTTSITTASEGGKRQKIVVPITVRPMCGDTSRRSTRTLRPRTGVRPLHEGGVARLDGCHHLLPSALPDRAVHTPLHRRNVLKVAAVGRRHMASNNLITHLHDPLSSSDSCASKGRSTTRCSATD